MNRHSSAFCFIISENGWLVKTRMNERHELHLGALSLETHPGVMGMSESGFFYFKLGGTTALFVPTRSIGFLSGLFLYLYLADT